MLESCEQKGFLLKIEEFDFSNGFIPRCSASDIFTYLRLKNTLGSVQVGIFYSNLNSFFDCLGNDADSVF